MSNVLTSAAALSDALAPWRAKEARLGLVPTMGALHDGHRSLIEAAVRDCEVVVVSVFVNPTQFGPGEDFQSYPRDLEHDLEVIAAAGARWCFAPPTSEIYPAGPPEIRVDPGPLAEILEGGSRPGHFSGVLTVVAKLFALFAPASAYFGEKDYQQLVLVRRMARDLSFRVAVRACPTVREVDGLAKSSRNRRLSPAERAAAPVLYQALRRGAELFQDGGAIGEIDEAMQELVRKEPLARLDYAVARDPDSLLAPRPDATELRLLLAASFGGARLIDNLAANR